MALCNISLGVDYLSLYAILFLNFHVYLNLASIRFMEVMMQYSEAKFGRVFILKLESGEIIHETIEKFAGQHHIKAGVVLIVCGTGQTMKLAQNQVYNRIKNIIIPHMYYRKDIGDRWYEDSDKLHSWGYLREL